MSYNNETSVDEMYDDIYRDLFSIYIDAQQRFYEELEDRYYLICSKYAEETNKLSVVDFMKVIARKVSEEATPGPANEMMEEFSRAANRYTDDVETDRFNNQDHNQPRVRGDFRFLGSQEA